MPNEEIDIGTSQGTVDNLSGMTRRLTMKVAKIRNVHPEQNTVDLEWLWPVRGGADGVSIGRPYIGLRSGIQFMPEVGSVVIVGYAFNQLVMLSYLLPADYAKMLDGQTDSNGVPSRIRQLSPGEIALNSRQNAEIYVHENIEIRDRNNNKITMLPEDGSINFDSLIFKMKNEAGNIVMGPVIRSIGGNDVLITNDGEPVATVDGGNGLTELKISINEYADGTVFGNTENPPIAEVTVGTLVDDNGNKVLNQAGNEIVCNIEMASGAKIQIDKAGNFNMNEANMLKPTDPPAVATDPDNEVVVAPTYTNASQQRAAREGDRVTIPITTPLPTDSINHPGLTSKSATNQLNMLQIASMFNTVVGPCIFIPSAPGVKLVSEITQGSDSVFIGSLDKAAETLENNNNQ